MNQLKAPNPPKMLGQNQTDILKHKERVKNFINEYTQEILTRKDFRLLNNVFNPTAITEKELDKMEVAGDGFEHLDIFQNMPDGDESNSYLDGGSKYIEEFKTLDTVKKSTTNLPVSKTGALF